MIAGRHDFVIEQGVDWTRSISWRDSGGTNKSLSGLNGRFVIRPFLGDTGTPIKQIIQSDSGMTLSDNTYNIILLLTDTETASYTFMRAVYILEIEVGGLWIRVLQGNIRLNKDIT